MDISNHKSRYTRADLLALRYDGKSRLRPRCANQTDLQALHFWKVNFNAASNGNTSGYSTQHKNSISPDTETSNLNSSGNSFISSRRAIRNRERANNYYQRFVPIESNQTAAEDKETHVTHGKSFKSTSIDHRSISSSHLMPAFAKRRFTAVNGGTNPENNESPPNIGDDDSSSNFELIDRTCTPTHDRNDGKAISTCLPIPNFSKPENDPCLALSPSSTSRQERRIGSGRLLPRNDSWDYKEQKAKDSSIEKEKDVNYDSGATHQKRPRPFSSDRSTDQTERRYQYDKRSSERHGLIIRRVSNKDSNINQGRGKRSNTFHSHEKHEEPEWFSAGPTSQLETIDLHGFEDIETNDPNSEVKNEYINFSSDNNNVEKHKMVPESPSKCGSNTSINVTDSVSEKQNDSQNFLNIGQTPVEVTNRKENQRNQFPGREKVQSEFNFDAFLNLHPLDHPLMSNDGVEKGETKGTSRFSHWFRHKESKTYKDASIQEPHSQDKLGIPNVKDLEAQMTKLGISTEYASQMSTPMHSSEHTKKPGSRDTEAFKKLLQQLGSQTKPQHSQNDVYQIVNTSNARGQDVQETQQVILPNVLSSSSNVTSLKRMEKQNLIQSKNFIPYKFQSLINGDVSMEFLENELSNPNTLPSTKNAIATVLREYTNTRKSFASAQPIFSQSALNHSQQFHQQISEDMFSPNTSNGINQQLNHSNSPTPLAFTPTSVLRKMTADKDTHLTQGVAYNHQHQFQIHQQYSKQVTNVTYNEPQESPAMSVQPRMILGGGNYTTNSNGQDITNLPQCRNQPIIKWPPVSTQMVHGKTFGRPILKGGLNSIPPPFPSVSFTSNIDMPHANHQQLSHHIHQHHQPNSPFRFKSSQITESLLNSENMHHNITYPDAISQMQHHAFWQQQSRQPGRQRVIHGELTRESNVHISQVPECSDSLDSGNMIDYLRLPTTNWHSGFHLNFLQASAGKLPLLNINQALSLEEFERIIQHSSIIAHN
ncbi:eukaryotic translation initiation factor 4E transporter isoform X1 [Drosophila ananassae]|uniref:eukaryotic translation initiation factor 4E transporter isoform X1 n=1 Tax=Drosophila ananassae TaxID=7217 RepID=UPI0013A5DA23|nr:eukaryotic translation initiation factor 4E transporter isoform X1 [Drosophila ananassae]